jgi:ADP-ribose pyrophosphatase YjhB (NUDIX family)
VPAVGVAVVESERVLLIRRRYQPMMGAWAIPGGFMEAREAPETTARRELYEETGLRVRLSGLLGAYRGGGESGKVLFLCYRGVVLSGTLEAGDDASEVGFFSLWKPPEPLAVGPHPIVLEQLRTSLAPGPGRK